MTDTRKVMQQALEALETALDQTDQIGRKADWNALNSAIKALREALAQQGEPDEFGTKAFKDYLSECDECCVEPDVAGAFNGGYQRGKEALAQQGEQTDELKYPELLVCPWCDSKDRAHRKLRFGSVPCAHDWHTDAPAAQPMTNEQWLDIDETQPLHVEAAPASQPLTDEQIDAIEERVYCKTIQKGKTRHVYFQQLARAIERHHGIGADK